MSTAAPDPAPIRAVSVALEGAAPFDPVALAGPDGIVFSDASASFAGRGAALTLELPGGLEDPAALARSAAALGAIDHDDRTGVGPPGAVRVRAFAALPFERRAAGTLVVPDVTFCRAIDSDGRVRQWATLVGPVPGPQESDVAAARRWLEGPLADPAPAPGDPPVAVRLRPEPEPELYADAVAKALTGIEAGSYSKIVLGRRLDAEFSGPLDPLAVLRRLAAAEPQCTLFCFPLADGGRFLGATPELLVARNGPRVTCRPLAGTVGLGAPGGDEAAVERFLASAKDRAEHRAVVDEIVAVLTRRCSVLEADPAPRLVRLHSVAHLGTRIEGTLDEDGPGILELLAELHPTPAVGGVPRAAALAGIDQLEPFDRERWAGPVGWVDAAGDGRFMVGIRSTLVRGARARLWAGAGIVTGSQPEAELAETTVKLAPVLEALAPGTAP